MILTAVAMKNFIFWDKRKPDDAGNIFLRNAD
jgi:hypothetical protein